jgi:hypothetical protein
MTVKKRPGEIVQVNLRMREDFRQRLLREAEKGERSFNQELVRRLEESFRREDEVLSKEVLLKGWEERFADLKSAIDAHGAKIDRMKRESDERLKKAESEK